MKSAVICKELLKSKNPKAKSMLVYDEFSKSVEESKVEFLSTLSSCGEDLKPVMNWLEESTFFEDPASGKYHNAFRGGLVDHSLNVYHILNEKNKLLGGLVPLRSVIISALLHDVCKIGSYNIKESWRKDEKNRWESYRGYGYNDDPFPAGHGEKSVMLLCDKMSLTKDEMLAIRWHGGPVEDPKGYGFINAAKTSALTLLLHTSDFEASILLEPQGVIEWLVDKR